MTALVGAQIIQIIISVFLVLLVLIQGKGGGLSSSVGGSMTSYRSRRGVERVVFLLTIIMGIALVVNSIVIIALS